MTATVFLLILALLVGCNTELPADTKPSTTEPASEPAVEPTVESTDELTKELTIPNLMVLRRFIEKSPKW